MIHEHSVSMIASCPLCFHAQSCFPLLFPSFDSNTQQPPGEAHLLHDVEQTRVGPEPLQLRSGAAESVDDDGGAGELRLDRCQPSGVAQVGAEVWKLTKIAKNLRPAGVEPQTRGHP